MRVPAGLRAGVHRDQDHPAASVGARSGGGDDGYARRRADGGYGHRLPVRAAAGLGVRIRLSRRPGESCAERRAAALRSEEHTSELQSLMRISYAVFCLKKKTTQI